MRPPPARLTALGTAAAVLLVLLWVRWVDPRDWTLADVAVYIRGGRALLEGTDLYAVTAGVLPFTYPPFAAVLFVPLALLGGTGSGVVVSLLSLLALVVLVAVSVARRTPASDSARALAPRPELVAVGGLLFVAALTTEAVQRTLVLGQVNLVLAAVVAVDLLLLPRRWRGVLLGLAIAVKLTPAVFLGYLLLRREWAALARGSVTVAVTVAAGWVLAPSASATFWSGGASSLGRFGDEAAGYGNQSLGAALDRFAPGISDMVWLLLVVAVVALSAVATWRTQRRRDDLAAVTALAVGGLLVSPISWTHHWVWVVPVMAVLLARRWRVGLFVAFAVMYLPPMVLVAETGLDVGAAQPVVDATWTILGVVYLVALAGWPGSGVARGPGQVENRGAGQGGEVTGVDEHLAGADPTADHHLTRRDHG
ncbi:MAG: glycosyltransferase 87 family protein [Pedococcus sp.]